jgi:hypothetical protein
LSPRKKRKKKKKKEEPIPSRTKNPNASRILLAKYVPSIKDLFRFGYKQERIGFSAAWLFFLAQRFLG